MIRFGKCQACSCKDSEITFLRSLVRPEPSPKRSAFESIEADAIIGGNDMQIEINDEQFDKIQTNQRQDEIDSEAAKILSGNY